MLEVRDIHTNYGDSQVLQGVSLEVGEGSIVAVLGRNGVGKTTLIRSIIGFSPPRAGSIWLRGHKISDEPPHVISRLGVGLVPQGRRIFSSLTVLENLAVARQSRAGGTWDQDRVLDRFPRMRQRLSHRGSQLSGGEQQMLAGARALVGNPSLLLMDEPSEGLAPLLVRELADVIVELKDSGLAILLVEQNLPLALRLADYINVMSKGQIVHRGPPDELVGNTEITHRYLGV
ncbi:MAG: ABC transporter ATP-binding protein [Acidimicrobiaceae bacterium]|nr:ABC transporter ATP-binding protein [Acidimicrobiaceae bacterium]